VTLPHAFKAAATQYFNGDVPTFATVLVSALLKMYGAEALNWDGATIQLEIKDDLDVEMPRRVYDQMMGLITAMTTDSVYKDARVFDSIVSALNRQGIVPDNIPPTVEDVAWTVAELGMSDPEPVSRTPGKIWGSKIQAYVRAVLDDEGFTIAPDILSFAHTRTPAAQGMDDASVYAGTWGSAQARADEIDTEVQTKAVELLKHLDTLGINVTAEAAP
jgi:hypothetical protein